MRTPSRAAIRVLLASLSTVLALPGCIEDASVTLPKTANLTRNRSVVVDASMCVLGDGSLVACPANPSSLVNGIQVAGLRGVNGVPLAAIPLDVAAAKTNFGSLHAYWTRLPVGYGCGATLQGIFPNRNAAHEDAGGKTATASFNFTAFQPLLAAAREANTVPLWTAAYDLGDGLGSCVYENGQQKGTGMADPAKWAKVVRQVARYFDRELPSKNAETPSCKVAAGTTRPWDCSPSIFNIEYGRDPFGAGGFTQATLPQWLNGYVYFATELRQEFPLPGNDVNLIGPSVVIQGELGLNGSPIYAFIDFLADPAKNFLNPGKRLALSYLSIEIEAGSPLEAHKIASAVATYAAGKKLLKEDSLRQCFNAAVLCTNGGACTNNLCSGTNVLCANAPLPCQTGEVCGADNKCRNDGTVIVPLWVTDLRPSKSSVLPEFIAQDPALYSAWVGAFFAATKTLWQGVVSEAVSGNAVRFPTVVAGSITDDQLAKTATDSTLIWYASETMPQSVTAGSLKPAAWQSFWFNEGFLARHQRLSVQHGPDPLKTSGTESSNPNRGLILLATREKCTNDVGTDVDCITDSKMPAVTKDRKRMIRVLISDMDVGNPGESAVLEHQLRLQIDSLPADVKTVGYRWAYMDGGKLSWSGFVFPEQGLADVTDGSLHLTRTVPVPSVHYIEFLF